MNTWDEALNEPMKPSFINTVHPCHPLNSDELKDLEIGWLYHTPDRSAEVKDRQQTLTEEYNEKTKETERRKSRVIDRAQLRQLQETYAKQHVDDYNDDDYKEANQESTFITQLTDVNAPGKRVTFNMSAPTARSKHE